MRNLRDQKGFTLIELMIVVVIIGILAALAIPRFTGASRNAKMAEADGPLAQMCTLASAYYERYGTVATNETFLKQVGWGDQTKNYFGYTYNGTEGGTLGTATADAAQGTKPDLKNPTAVVKKMDCVDREIKITQGL